MPMINLNVPDEFLQAATLGDGMTPKIVVADVPTSDVILAALADRVHSVSALLVTKHQKATSHDGPYMDLVFTPAAMELLTAAAALFLTAQSMSVALEERDGRIRSSYNGKTHDDQAGPMAFDLGDLLNFLDGIL